MGAGQFKPDNLDETQMHENFTTAAYGKQGRGDRIPMGDGQIQMGAKILQNPETSELYVVDDRGHHWDLTSHGKPLPNVIDRVKLAANYKQGPAVMITGPPTHPNYTMFSATDEDTGSFFHPVVVNNYSDLYHAVEHRGNFAKDEIGQIGFAAVNPFMERPRDVWSAVADENRAITNFGADLVVPVAEAVLDDFVPFASSVLNATGITDLLQHGLSDALHASYDRKEWESSTPFYPPMSNVITDPRLDHTLASASREAETWASKTNDPSLQSILGDKAVTPQEKVAKLDKMHERTMQLYASATKKVMDHNLAELTRVGVDVSDLEAGLAAADTADQILHVASFLNGRIQKQIVPGLDSGQKEQLMYAQTTTSGDDATPDARFAKDSVNVAAGASRERHWNAPDYKSKTVINGETSHYRGYSGQING